MKKRASFVLTLLTVWGVILFGVLGGFCVFCVFLTSAAAQPVSGDFSGNALDDLMKSLIEMKTFDAEKYGLDGNYEITGEISAKFEENQEPARVRLVALRREDGVYNRGFLLEVIPPSGEGEKGSKEFLIPLSDDVRGFEASIEPKNFTSREKSEIFLTVAGGKWGDRYMVIALAGKQGEVILDTYAKKIPAVTGRYFDDYRAEIIVRETGERALIDLSARTAAYNRRLVYNESGRLRSRVVIWVDKFSAFEPVDADGDGILEIKEVMNLSGVGRPDRVAYVEATLKRAGGKWNVIDSWIAPAEDLDKMPIPRRID